LLITVRVRVRAGVRCCFQVRLVVVTVPLGVLKRKRITFEPALPLVQRDAIEKLSMGSDDKIVLRFAQAYWPLTLGYVQAC
jgi:monoamine oxidase